MTWVAVYNIIIFAVAETGVPSLMLIASGAYVNLVSEGFITRYGEQMHPIVTYGIILSSLTLIIYYYIIYPIRLNPKQSFLNIKK